MDKQQAIKLWTKARKRRIGPEARMQMALIDHMHLGANDGCAILSIPNEHFCNETRGAMLNRMGRMKGASDLMVLVPGRQVFFLELKAKGERPSAEQIAFGDLVKRCGQWWQWADNIDDALRLLISWGALKPNVSLKRAGSPASSPAREAA